MELQISAADAFVVSRCKEKSFPYSLTTMRKVLEEIVDLSQARRVEWWSDGGKHFRSVATISTMVLRIIEQLCLRSQLPAVNPTATICYGLPKHFKNVCDGGHSYVRGLISQAAMKSTISTLKQFVDACRTLHAEHRASAVPLRKCKLPITFHDYFPSMEKSEFCKSYIRCFKPASFIESVGVCQCFEGRLNDRRRMPNPLYKSPTGVYTAIDFRSAMLHNGQVCPAERVCLPLDDPDAVVCADAEPDAAAEEEEAQEAEEDYAYAVAEPANGVIAMNTSLHMGWRSPYRKLQPESRAFAEWSPRWTRARKRWEAASIRLLLARTRRSVSDQLALQEKWAAARRVHRPIAPPAGAARSSDG